MKLKNLKRPRFNLAIIGGGKACCFFIDLIEKKFFQHLDIHIVGIYDLDPNAPGMLLAKKKKIITTTSFEKLFKIQDIDTVIDLANNQILPELIAKRPNNIGIIEHNIGKVLRKLFEVDQKLISNKEVACLDKSHYEILFKQTNIGVVVLDPEFEIVDANRIYLKGVKKLKKNVVGKKCYEIVRGFSSPCSLENPDLGCPFLKTLKTGKSSQVIHEQELPGGNTVYFNVTTYAIKNQRKEVVQIIELWRNITAKFTQKWQEKVKKIEADMKKVIQEDRLVSLGKLVASSVHEINNPIQGLLTFSHLMNDMVAKKNLEEKDLSKMRKFTSHMTRELERCGNIVSGLLAFSRESTLEFINMDISFIIDTIISLTSHKLKLSDIELKDNRSPLPFLVCGDINQLQQCFLNLIFNAIEAMPNGGQLSIRSGYDKTKNKIWVEIADNGCGIRDSAMEHIFDPFFTTKEVGEGTGLGLSIVYGIIKDHNGKVKVKTTPGQGTSFKVFLPCV
ncbi:MAG: PAS domain-containing protein [Deltaproteobacteria bacterium]|jgi:two-component system, NtrC family, sensor kinase|nr:PAS domain-containing protein [Deltaproteobacteria bacterium]MBT4527069.1 PAS domain-containing protein [Deltaproteobacteria bacterium]